MSLRHPEFWGVKVGSYATAWEWSGEHQVVLEELNGWMDRENVNRDTITLDDLVPGSVYRTHQAILTNDDLTPTELTVDGAGILLPGISVSFVMEFDGILDIDIGVEWIDVTPLPAFLQGDQLNVGIWVNGIFFDEESVDRRPSSNSANISALILAVAGPKEIRIVFSALPDASIEVYNAEINVLEDLR